MAIGNDPVVDALIDQCADMQEQIALLAWGAMTKIEGLQMAFRLTARAQSRHTLSTVPTRELLQPEARRRARALRTWAKPKGWRL